MPLSKRNSLVTTLLTIILVNTIGGLPLNKMLIASAAETTVVKVEPALIEYRDYAVGKEFTFAIKIINVTNLYGFDISFRWNTTILEYVSHVVHVPKDTYSDGVLWNPVIQLPNTGVPNQTTGNYRVAFTSLGAPAFNGSGTVFTMTLRVKYHPRHPEPTLITKLELYATDLAAYLGGPISHQREEGTVILYAIPAEVRVDPEVIEYGVNATGQQFTISVRILNVTNLYHFGILLIWNTTFLEYVGHSIRVPKSSYPDGVLWDPVVLGADEVNIADGIYHIAYSSEDPAPSFNGSGTVFTMTFLVKHHPSEPEPTATIKLELYEAELFEADYTEILCTKKDGAIILRQIPKRRLSVEPAFIEFGNSNGDEIPIPGTKFSVAARIRNVANLYGFDVKFRWNTTFLQYVNRSVRIPQNTYADGVLWNPVFCLADQVNPATGTYWIAYSSSAPAPSFNGSGTIFTMTFQVIKQAYDFETGTPAVDPIDLMLDFVSVEFAERGGKPVTLAIEPATVRMWERSFELPPNPALKVMPSNVEKLPINSTFEINIWILGLNSSYDIASFNVTLNFNPAFIEASNLMKGEWAENYAEGTTEILKQIKNTVGTVTYAIELIPPRKQDPPTTGILFTVSFRVIYESLQYPPPSTELTLDPTSITDRVLGPILHTKWNGTYTANRPPPKAKFSWSPNSYLLPRGQTIIFNASESHHPLGGKIESYHWDFGDGTSEETTEPVTFHAYSTSGTMTVILNVTDYGGFWDTKGITLYIIEPPPRPYIAAEPTSNKFGPYPPQIVGQPFNISIYIRNLDTVWFLQHARFSLSYNATLIDIIGDSKNVTISSLWKGPNSVVIVRSQEATGKVTCTVRNPTVIPSGTELIVTMKFTIKHQGIYPAVDTSPITLSDISLTGSLGEIPTEYLIHAQIVIRGLSSPLRAYFTYSPSSPRINETVTFNASDSTPEAFIANYRWNLGGDNITTVSSSALTHKFSSSKTYNVTLTVTDIDGSNNTTWKTITVEPITKAAIDFTPYIGAGVAIAILSIVVIYYKKIRKPKRSPK